MASVTRLDSDGRRGYRIRFYVGERQKEIYLPGLSKKIKGIADTIAVHCEALAQAMANNVAPAPESLAWAATVEGRLRENLVAWGLADPVSPKLTTDEGRLLGAFLTAYIASRSDVKPITRVKYGQTKRMLVEYFGEKKPLKAITKGDAERWRRWLTSDKALASSTVSKEAKRAKTIFSAAVQDRLLPESPFAHLRCGDEINSDRQSFIDRATTKRVLASCPDVDWRVIFGLARFAGLRCPTEVLGLKWTDVLWDSGRLRIDSVKTGLRYCPIFPELLPILLSAAESAPDGAIYCVGRYRGAEVNLRTNMLRIIKNAGVVAWPKLFVNLRSTRRTELQEMFPDHVVNCWLGHSAKVAAKHYLQVTDDHWERATESRPLTGSLVSGPADPIRKSQKTKKPSILLGSDGSGVSTKPPKVPPQGLEPWTR